MTTDYTAALTRAEQDSSITRSQLTLAQVGSSWARDGAKGARFIRGLATWLNSYTNDTTRRINGYSALEFFEWYEANRTVEGRRGQIPLPWQVTRDDANAYAKYLRGRKYGLEEERLRKDPTKKLDLTIYLWVKSHPRTGFSDIRRHLLADPSISRSYRGGEPILSIEVDDPLALDRMLACMVEAKILRRSPTIEELRRNATLGKPYDDTRDWARVGLDERAPPEIFSYSLDPHTEATAEERSSTVLRRLATLSALWRHYIERGENTESSELLKYNVWSDLVQQEGRIAPLQQRVHRLQTTPTMEHWRALVRTTEGNSIEDIRDRALLVLMLWMGLRVTEMVRMKRKDRVVVDGKVYLRLLRKRAKAEMLMAPQPVLRALNALDMKIAALANDAESKQASIANKLEMQTGMPAGPMEPPRWRRLLESPDAPLIPAVARWGCNASADLDTQDAPLTRQAVAMMLRRRAVAAGIAEADWDKIHPHGFRRLGARTAYEAGTPLTTIQVALGHDSISTTGRYIEDREREKVALFPGSLFVEETAAEASTEAAAETARPLSRRERREEARRRAKETIEARGTVVEETEPVVGPMVEPETVSVILEEEAPAGGGVSPPAFPSRVPPLAAAGPMQVGEADTLVGMSACAPIADVGAGMPDYAYEPGCWGERGKNGCGQAASMRVAGTEQFGESRYADAEGNPIYDPLTYAWVGRASRLPWWTGSQGTLPMAMPILSASQLAGSGNVLKDLDGTIVEDLPFSAEMPRYGQGGVSIQQMLIDLWSDWFNGEGSAAPPAQLPAPEMTPNPGEEDVDWASVQRLYRLLAATTHPDVTGGDETAVEAYRAAIDAWNARDVASIVDLALAYNVAVPEDEKYDGVRDLLAGVSGVEPEILPEQAWEELSDVPIWPDSAGSPLGPTAAAALAVWVAEAMFVSQEFVSWAVQSQYEELSFPDDDNNLVDDPDEIFKTHRSYRQHREDQILRWFEENARQARFTKGDVSKGEVHRIDTRPVTSHKPPLNDTRSAWQPDWFAASDPLAMLPKDELDALMARIASLTGQTLRGQTVTFKSKINGVAVSFDNMTDLLGNMCQYDALLTERTQMEGITRPRSEIEADIRVLGQTINETLMAYGWQPQEVPVRGIPGEVDVIDYPHLVQRRRKKTAEARQGQVVEEGAAPRPPRKIEKPEAFYVKVLSAIFGKELADNQAIRLMAKCTVSGPPLAAYADLLRIDPSTGRLGQTPEYQRKHRNTFGADPGCVAKRIARWLYEMRKDLDERNAARLAEGKKRLTEKPSGLIDIIDTMKIYRVPCSPDVEGKLRNDRIRDARADLWTQPENEIERVWQQAMARQQAAIFGRVAEEEVGEAVTAFEEATETEAGRQAQEQEFGREYEGRVRGSARARANPEIIRAVPNPIALLFACFM